MGSYRRQADRFSARLDQWRRGCGRAGHVRLHCCEPRTCLKDVAEISREALRDTGRVGIDSLQKSRDFLLNLPLDDLDLRRDNLQRLGLVLHFRLHSLHPKTNLLDLSRRRRLVGTNTRATDKFWFGDEAPNISATAGTVNSTFVAIRCFSKLARSAAGAARSDGSQEQLGAQAAAREMGSDGFSCPVNCGAGIEKNDDRWTCTTESYAENAWGPG